MLSERDRKALRFTLDHPFLARYALWLLPAVFTAMTAGQLYAASMLGEPVGHSLLEVFRLWLSGLNPTASYLGIEASAILSVERALSMLGLAVLSAGVASAVSIGRAREQRLADLLGMPQDRRR